MVCNPTILLTRLGRILSASAVALCFCLLAVHGAAAQDAPVKCGLGNGQPATGAPIVVGAVVGKTGPADFSAGAAAARAYFACVNANGGIHGRPVKYIIEDDQWNPQIAAQVAAKLVNVDHVVALVGSGSFVDASANAAFYAKNNVLSLSAACPERGCYEASNMAAVDAGPAASGLAAEQYAVKYLGAKSVVCITINMPNSGNWSCQLDNDWMKAHGLTGTQVLINGGSIDMTSALLQAEAQNPDTILLNLPAPYAIAALKAAVDQGVQDQYHFIGETTLYDPAVPSALHGQWDGKLFIQTATTPIDGKGPDATLWREVMKKYGVSDAAATARMDAFSQEGFVAARVFVKALLEMNPADIDRANVTKEIRAMPPYKTDLLCRPWYFGPGNRHYPNRTGLIVTPEGKGFKTVHDCLTAESSYFAPIVAEEKKLGL
ncbi:ABC transporter substrate-binding protein [Acidocella sp.]|uniref:ABC transporter substrate-binding protein n=1 Tax=Acidocella sp. TaxID=50710 RepID=UPI003D03F574